MLEAQIKLMDAKLAAMRGFWNYFRRRAWPRKSKPSARSGTRQSRW
jgi:hypothetical protein